MITLVLLGLMSGLLIGAWGRELTDEENRLNQILIDEGKAEKCAYFERYFNSSFKKSSKV